MSGTGNIASLVDDVSLNLYGAAADLIPNGNLMISPVSILYATVLVYLGARGSTKSNLYSSLHFNVSFPDVNTDVASAFGELMGQYKDSASSSRKKTSEKSDNDFQLSLGNAVFVQDGLEMSQRYLDKVNKDLKAAAIKENFIKETEKSRADINRWIEERTGGKIPDLIPPGAIDTLTKVVLANAVYFKASWRDIFAVEKTKNSTFTLLGSSTVTAPMMNSVNKYFYAEDNDLGLQYLELPYANEEASMLIFLPKENQGLRKLEKSLTPQKLHQLASSTQHVRVKLSLPKFKIAGQYDLKTMLRKIGVQNIFATDADLRDMVPGGDVHVTDAFHKTYTAVDEKGTTAAAATGMVMGARSAMRPREPRIVTFVADHPFMFAIRHNPSRSILFLGRLEKP